MKKILALLVQKGYSQLGFERAAGLPRNRITKWKSGQGEPSLLEGMRMAHLLGISLDDLVDAKKVTLPVNDLTEDERFIVTVIRKGNLTSDEVVQRLMPKERKKAAVRPHRSKSGMVKGA